MKKTILTAAFVLAVCAWVIPTRPASAQSDAPTPKVTVLRVQGIIDPLVVQYLRRNLESPDASLFVITLDTPGGSGQSMREIIQLILGSRAPVVVYVYPPGASAGSAGMFITIAAHVAAMSPSTNIGAAHPVGSSGEDIPGYLGDKAEQDAAALARSLAERYGRNATWVEDAVLKSVSVTALEAKQLNVIDLLADDLDDLLALLDGREVATSQGMVRLSTENAQVEQIPMTALENFLHMLVNPNIVYVLWTIGMLAIVVELYHPGAVLPGVTGAICLVLAFVASESLPLNWGGIALIVLAIIFFVLDIKVAGFGLSVGGAIALVLGSVILFSPFSPESPTLPHFRVNPWLIAGVTGVTVLLFLFVISAGFRAQRLRVPIGIQTVVGAQGIVQVDLNPTGIVLVQSETWSATAEDPPIPAGEKIVVTGVDGVKLIVRKV